MILPVQRNVWRIDMGVRSDRVLVGEQVSSPVSRQTVSVPANWDPMGVYHAIALECFSTGSQPC